jgi:hypothetical protein
MILERMKSGLQKKDSENGKEVDGKNSSTIR